MASFVDNAGIKDFLRTLLTEDKNNKEALINMIEQVELTPGPQGPQGEVGPAGPQGPKGDAAPAEIVREEIQKAITEGKISNYDDTEVKESVQKLDSAFKNQNNINFQKQDADLRSVKVRIVKGNIVENKPVVSDSGTGKIFDYTRIAGGLVYVFDYIFNAYFYDSDKNFLGNGTKVESQCYLAPDNAVYMVAEYPEGRTGGMGPEGWQIGVCKQTYYPVWNADVRKTILETTNQCKGTYTQLPSGKRTLSTYFIGDSEASRGYNLFRTNMFTVPCLSSFGGHKSDFVATNIGVTMNEKDDIIFFNNMKVLLICGTNDTDETRLRGYMVEMLARLRDTKASELWGTGYFCGYNVTQEQYNESKKYKMQKSLYGGRFIDQINVAFGMGLYFNLYHPSQFTQPSVGGDVTIAFEDVTAMTECGMFAANKDFYMQYYDDKYDVYTCKSIDTTENTIVATLKTNNSGIAPGSAAGMYKENVSTGSWTGDKTTIAWVYDENDKTNVESNKLPYNIYQDHQVHFGKIFGRIIDTLLFSSGFYEGGEKGLTNRNQLPTI